MALRTPIDSKAIRLGMLLGVPGERLSTGSVILPNASREEPRSDAPDSCTPPALGKRA